jgi:asparagine N-glycosylation enzyme membrane subunit Stt3
MKQRNRFWCFIDDSQAFMLGTITGLAIILFILSYENYVKVFALIIFVFALIIFANRINQVRLNYDENNK